MHFYGLSIPLPLFVGREFAFALCGRLKEWGRGVKRKNGIGKISFSIDKRGKQRYNG